MTYFVKLKKELIQATYAARAEMKKKNDAEINEIVDKIKVDMAKAAKNGENYFVFNILQYGAEANTRKAIEMYQSHGFDAIIKDDECCLIWMDCGGKNNAYL